MGTLDDAIREHLELKKRSGASQEEVQRLEHEAFGPVRREPPAPAAEPPAAEAGEPVEPAAEAPPAPEPLEPHAAPPPQPAAREDGPWLEDDPDEVPFGDALDHRRDEPQPTSEFTAAEHADAAGTPPTDYVAPDDEGEDLLEETPDFLQETPEHDRLWFEQRPPRDFDFDE